MKCFFQLSVICAIMVLGNAVHAQSTTEVVAPGATVTTTVEAPGGTTVTRVTAAGGPSIMTKLKDGTKVEMDSDGSVYQVYSDGARTTMTDGMHTLMDGTAITVKDGKRIP